MGALEAEKLLVVDDDEGILYTLEAIGRMAGWSVDTATGPETVLASLKHQAYDVIIVDYHMPDMDGVELVREIRKIDATVPVMVLTVDERLSLAKRFTEAGANDFAVKPIKAADFISRIRLHLASEGSPKAIEPEDLPKGLSPETMELVLEALREFEARQEWVNADKLAARIGISYPTVWRYLGVLEEEGSLAVRLEYGGRGRPSKLYMLA